MSREVELGWASWTSFASSCPSCSSTAVQRTLSLWLCPSTAVETAIVQCTSRWAMARGHRLNTSIVLAAVHGLSGLFRAVSAVEPSFCRPLPTLSPSLIGHLASVDVKQQESKSTQGPQAQIQSLCFWLWVGSHWHWLWEGDSGVKQNVVCAWCRLKSTCNFVLEVLLRYHLLNPSLVKRQTGNPAGCTMILFLLVVSSVLCCAHEGGKSEKHACVCVCVWVCVCVRVCVRACVHHTCHMLEEKTNILCKYIYMWYKLYKLSLPATPHSGPKV